MLKEIRDKLLIVQPIFCPNDIGFEIQMDSIRSFFDYCYHYNYHDLNIIYSGYCAKEEYWDHISKLCIMKPHNIKIEKFPKNYGKAVIVNKMVYLYDKEYKYLFTFDSDIKFDLNENDIIKQLYDIAEQLPNFGLLSLNQLGINCQLYNHYTESKQLNGHTLCWHPGGAGIAGGCLFVSMKAFRDIKGYREMGVYDSDDGFLMLDLANKKYFLATIKTLSIIHPKVKELKEGYNQWKSELLNNRRNVGGGRYEHKMIDAENFWRN